MNVSKFLVSCPFLYGRGHSQECIESVVHKPNVDCHFIDNGAEEPVKELLNHYERSYSNVKVHREKFNTFVNPAINTSMQYFLDHPEYDYFISINSDLILEKNWDIVVRKRLALYPDEICLPTIVEDKLFTSIVVDSEPVEGTVITGGVNGVFMIFNRTQIKAVFPIPDILKIWYGDNFLFEICRGIGYKTVMSSNFIGYHAHSQTVQKVEGISAMIEDDKVNWEKVGVPTLLERIKNYMPDGNAPNIHSEDISERLI